MVPVPLDLLASLLQTCLRRASQAFNPLKREVARWNAWYRLGTFEIGRKLAYSWECSQREHGDDETDTSGSENVLRDMPA